MAMFGYMTDLERVQIEQVHHVEAEADDLLGLLYHFLDELLFMFSAEPYIVAKVCSRPSPSTRQLCLTTVRTSCGVVSYRNDEIMTIGLLY